MFFTLTSFWMMLAAGVVALSCALLGNYLVLRRMSMMGDAISHAVLPGLALGFLLSGSRNLWVMLGGAIIAGILTTVFTQWLGRFGKVERGAAMGVVFTSLFALGLLLVRQHVDGVDLDADCVLYGALEVVSLDTWEIFGADIPRAVATGAIALVINGMFVAFFYKELKISSFDPNLSTTQGISANLMHYLLMVLVAITTVAAFEIVGSILVVAMLIAPPAAAYLLTHRLWLMIVLSMTLAVLAVILGHAGALYVPMMVIHGLGYLDAVFEFFLGPGQWISDDILAIEELYSATAGMVAVMSGVLFMVSLVCSPKRGLVVQWWRKRSLQQRIIREDVLGLLYRLEETNPGRPHGEQELMIAQGAHYSAKLSVKTLRQLKSRGLVLEEGRRWLLTDPGRKRGAKLIRAHRLWESYLQRHMHLSEGHLHRPAERLEHVTSVELAQRLADDAGDSPVDPHGKPIPQG